MLEYLALAAFGWTAFAIAYHFLLSHEWRARIGEKVGDPLHWPVKLVQWAWAGIKRGMGK